MMNGKQERITVSEFARRDGCDEKLVRRAIKEGRLTRGADKKLPAALVGSGWRAGNGAGVAGVRTDRTDHPGGVRNDAAPEMLDGESPKQAAERIAAAAVVIPPLGESLARKEYFLALLRELEFRRKDEALVEVEVAEQVLFEASRAARDAWLNWPSRFAPLIAADLGLAQADAVTTVLSTYVHRLLTELGEPDGTALSPGAAA